jgi:hypothetical protein
MKSTLIAVAVAVLAVAFAISGFAGGLPDTQNQVTNVNANVLHDTTLSGITPTFADDCGPYPGNICLGPGRTVCQCDPYGHTCMWVCKQ